MTKVILDFTEAKEFDRTPVPAGVYSADIDASYAQEVKYGKAKGTPYISLGYVITAPEEQAGRVVFGNYMLSGPGAGNTRQLLRVLGMYDDEAGNLMQFDVNSLHGHSVVIKVKMRVLGDGTEANDIAAVLPAKQD